MISNPIYDDEGNELCPKCGTIMEGHGCTGYSNIRNIPVESECSWMECPKCKFIIND